MSLPCAKVCSKFVGKVRRYHLACGLPFMRCRFYRYLYDAKFRATVTFPLEMFGISRFESCFMDFPNSDYIEVYKRLDFTVLIVDDRGKRFTFVKDLLVKYLVYRAEKTSFDKFFKIYVEFIELFCK
jgi:hypothetical protein